jgi:hypothetical protein
VRGFAFTALLLIGLDVALQSPVARVTSLLQLPTEWLAGWMDPGKPLIGPGQLATATAPASSASKQQPGGGLGVLGYVPKVFGF